MQESINNKHIAEQDSKTAAQQATKFQVDLQVAMLQAQAQYAMATNWNGKLPDSILPENSPLLLQLGAGGESGDEIIPRVFTAHARQHLGFGDAPEAG